MSETKKIKTQKGLSDEKPLKEDKEQQKKKPIKEKTPPPQIEKQKTPPPQIEQQKKSGLFSSFLSKKNSSEKVDKEIVKEEEVVEGDEDGEVEYEYYQLDEDGNEILVDAEGNPIQQKQPPPPPEDEPPAVRVIETPSVPQQQGIFSGLACSMYDGLRNVAESMGIVLYDESIKHLASNICRIPSLEGLCLLLQTGIHLFSTFECNIEAGNEFRDRFYQVLRLFGHPKFGVVEHCLVSGRSIDNDLIYHLETVISSSLRYLSRFARPDHLIYTLVSEKPKFVFANLNDEVDKITSDIIKAVDYKGSLKLAPIKNYNIACDIKTIVEKEKQDPEGFYQYLINEKGLPDVVAKEYQNELSEASQCLDQLTIEANILTSDWIGSSIGTGIRQRAFKRLWYDTDSSQMSSSLDKSVTDLCAIIQREITPENGNLDTELKTLLKRLLNVLTTVPTNEEGNMNFMDIIKAVRPIPYQEEDLVSVLESFTKHSLQKKRSIMPPPVHDIFWETGQEEAWVTAITGTRGWVSITGPSLTGKSFRLLSLCHNLKDRDVIWIDFFKVATMKEAISRVNSQLSLRGCMDLSSTSAELFELLTVLRKGSVIVFDNVDYESTNLESFFSEIIKHHKEFSTKLCFVVTSIQSCSFVENLSNPVHITLEKFSDETAIKMASEMKPDVSQSTMLPVDPIALQRAGENLPGKIVILAKMCALNSVRDLANELPEPDDPSFVEAISQAEESVSSRVFADLSDDEKLCARYILHEAAPFSEPLCWTLAKEAFCEDIARWNIAWKSLIEIGWIIPSADLGYSLSYLAAKCPKSTIYESDDIEKFELDLWNSYINYYALTFLNMSNMIQSNALAQEQYHFHFRGFRDVLNLFASYPESAVASSSSIKRSFIVFERISTSPGFFDEHISKVPSLGEEKVKDLAINFAGQLTHFYSLLHNSHKVQLAKAIYNSLTIEDGLIHLKARLDYARQLKILGQKENINDAINVMTLPKDYDIACGEGDHLLFASFYTTIAICHNMQNKKALADKNVTMAMSYWNNVDESIRVADPVFIEFNSAFPGKFDPPAPKKTLFSFIKKNNEDKTSEEAPKRGFFSFGKSAPPVEEETPAEVAPPVEKEPSADEAPKPKKRIVKKKVIKKPPADLETPAEVVPPESSADEAPKPKKRIVKKKVVKPTAALAEE